jgi:hypothetical protein
VSTSQEDPMRELVNTAKKWLETDECAPFRGVRDLVDHLTAALEMRLVRIAAQEREAWDQYAAGVEWAPEVAADRADKLLAERRKRFGVIKS